MTKDNLYDGLSLVLTSAGAGTRVRPASLYSATTMIPKGMMRVMGLPLAEIQLEQARAIGIERAYFIAMGLENRDQPAARFSDGQARFGLQIDYSHPIDDKTNNGSGDAILTNIERKDIGGTSLILSNDNLFEFNMKKALKRHNDLGAVVTVLTYPVTPAQTIQNYGLIRSDMSGRIEELIEKPDSEKEVLAALGCKPHELQRQRAYINTAGYIVNNEALREIAQKESWIRDGRLNSSDFDMAGVLLRGLIENGYTLGASAINKWGDFGSIPNYLETTQTALEGGFPSIQKILGKQDYEKIEGNIWIHKTSLNARSRGSQRTLKERMADGTVTVGSNTFIGKDVIIEDGVSLSNSDIEKSCYIGGGSDIDNSVVFSQSILGPNTTLDRALMASASETPLTKGAPVEITGLSAVGPQVAVSAGSKLKNATIYPGYRFNEGPESLEGVTQTPSIASLLALVSKYTAPGQEEIPPVGELISKIQKMGKLNPQGLGEIERMLFEKFGKPE